MPSDPPFTPPPHPRWSGDPGPVADPEADAGPIRPRSIEVLDAAGASATARPTRPRYGLAVVLFLLSLFTTTTLGAVWSLMTRTDEITDAVPLLTPGTVAAVWRHPEVLAQGLAFSLAALFILLCHEMGHYLTSRHYGLPTTPPFFLPAPIALGTFGAFIRIRGPIRGKRQLFDIGIAGPLAGFVALLPFLIYGVAHSRPAALSAVIVPENAVALGLYLPGKCLAIELVTRLFHGPLPPGTVLDLHPFALAAWFGLLATAINLLPLGQLDGGHILYAVAGRAQRRLALPLWIALGLAGLFWIGWLLWCAIVLVMGLRHPPVSDESEPLDLRRKVLAGVALLILRAGLHAGADLRGDPRLFATERRHQAGDPGSSARPAGLSPPARTRAERSPGRR